MVSNSFFSTLVSSIGNIRNLLTLFENVGRFADELRKSQGLSMLKSVEVQGSLPRNPRTRRFSPAASSSSTNLASLLTLPSLQSLAPLLLEPPPFSTSSFCVSSLQTAGAPAAAVTVYPPSLLLYFASAAEISVYDLASLHLLDSFPTYLAVGSVKFVAFSLDGRTFTAH